MSADGTADQGATTVHGELLTGSGKEYHHGLVCVDGSVIPTALGVNPLATITALAEHNVEHVTAKIGIEIDYETKNGLLDLFGPPAKRLSLTPDLKEAIEIIEDAKRSNSASMEFTEVMEGFIHIGGEIEDFAVAEGAAIGASSSARFFLSVRGWDTDTCKFFFFLFIWVNPVHFAE
jgi:choline dehydrogenase-like flavoprotein